MGRREVKKNEVEECEMGDREAERVGRRKMRWRRVIDLKTVNKRYKLPLFFM